MKTMELTIEERTCCISSALLPCVDVCMYESLLSPDEFTETQLESERCWNPIGEFLYEKDFNAKLYKQVLASYAGEYLQDEILPKLQPYGVEAIKPHNIVSPREYNFYGDELEFDIVMKEDFSETLYRNLEKFRYNKKMQDYVEEHWHSRSGFISFMPKSVDEIGEYWHDTERCISAYLTLCLINEGWKGNGDESEEFDSYNYLVSRMYEEGRADEALTISHYGDSSEAEELLLMYAQRADELNDLQWNVYYKIGRPWRNHRPENYSWNGEVKDELKRFTLWAIDKGYSLNDLRRMAE